MKNISDTTQEIWAKSVITCPHCKYQYLSNEIYTFMQLQGRPKDIIRDALGKILYVTYENDQEPALQEEYICDNCDRPFVVDCNISYKAKAQDEELDFSTTETSLL